MDALDALLARGPRLVALVHVSNVLGTVNPVASIARRAHDAGAVVLVDGTQAVPQMPVWLPDLDVDFYAWTGHKAYGPTGIGVLHGRRALLEEMPPVHRWRPHDPHGRRQRVDLDRPALEVRGRHLPDRRGDRAGRGGRLDPGSRDGARFGRTSRPWWRRRSRGCASSEVPGLTVQGPARRRGSGCARVVHFGGRPSARHRGHPGPRRRVRARRAPLRPAPDAPAGRAATTRASFAVHNSVARRGSPDRGAGPRAQHAAAGLIRQLRGRYPRLAARGADQPLQRHPDPAYSRHARGDRRR